MLNLAKSKELIMTRVVNSKEEFDNLCKESIKGKLVVIHFWAEWAPQCDQMNDVITELVKDKQYTNVTFGKVLAESLPNITTANQISSIPSFLFVRDGKVVERLEGANVPEFIKAVQAHLSKVLPFLGSSDSKQVLTNRLKALINSAPCVLFMKGNTESPKCGFSKQVIALLAEKNADYSTFDILQDETVRQGLKEYSKWPTYPQFYVNGELIGGIDILKELDASGELDTILPKKENLKDKLQRLINKEKVMIFMKGNPQVPKCGFSRTLVGILNEANVPYGTFDILEDEIVRQELKSFSNWPTYPQIYVNGSLIGGLDIVKELKETGDLEATLKGE